MLQEFRSQKITWDKANNNIYERVEAHEGDSNGRKLIVQVLNDGIVEDLTGSTLSLAWQTKDRANFGLDAFASTDITKGLFEIYYTTGMLANAGIVKASLVIVDSNGRLESKNFDIVVNRTNVDDEAVQSDNSFTALTQALAQVNQFDTRITDNKDSIEVLASKHIGTNLAIDTSQYYQAVNFFMGRAYLSPTGMTSLKEGDTVTLSAYLSNITVTGGVALEVAFGDSNDAEIGVITGDFVTTEGLYSFTFTIPQGAVTGDIAARLQTTDSLDNGASIRNLKLELGSLVTPWKPSIYRIPTLEYKIDSHLAEYVQLFDNSGYQRLPNGLIFQWGNTTTKTVVFPIEFTEICYNIQVTMRYSNSVSHSSVYALTKSGFFWMASDSAVNASYWFAIGK